MKRALRLVVNGLKSLIEKDCDFMVVLTAYNTYISNETDRNNYIYNINDKSDLITLINLGASAKTIAKIHDSGNNFVIVQENGLFVTLSSVEVLKYVLLEAENIAKCIIAYPFIAEYRPIYVNYVTNNIIE